jgi:hypothetical protein
MARRQRRGLSLLEAAGATAMVALMLVAALRTVGASMFAQSRSVENASAGFLATALMSEIVQQYYQNPVNPVLFGPEPGEAGPSRVNFNDVDEYSGWSESPPQKKDGSLLPNLNGWQRTVTVQWVSSADVKQSSIVESGVKLITVSVLHRNVVRATSVGIRTNAP